MPSSYLERPVRGYSEALAQVRANPYYHHHREGEAWALAFPERARARNALLALLCSRQIREGGVVGNDA